MGRQVNFYMTRDDENEFVEFIRSSPGAVFLMDNQPSQDLLIHEELLADDIPGWSSVCLWNQKEFLRPELKYVKSRNFYYIDKMASEVVEFDRCRIIDEYLVRGRIWAQMSDWRLSDDPPTIFNKGEVFVKWYERLANWIKRRSTRRSPGEYLLPGAAAFIAAGGRCR